MVTIRCNYTLENFDSLRNLIEDFREYWNYSNVRFSFHKVWQEPESTELFVKREALNVMFQNRGLNQISILIMAIALHRVMLILITT